jgi:Immunity protein 21
LGIATTVNHSTSPNIPWLDFSGAPPMLIPRRLATLWRGATDPSTNEFRELDMDNPVTDYDRACAVAWPGKSVLQFRDVQVLVLDTESDWHTWDGVRQIVACCRWLPSDDVLRQAIWTDRIEWHSNDSDLLLMNSAADGARGLLDGDFMPVQLPSGIYTVEFSHIEAELVGQFHRLVRCLNPPTSPP